MFLAQGIFPSLLVFLLHFIHGTESFHEKLVARATVIILNWSDHGLPLIERNLKKWILSTKSSCIRRQTTKSLICGLCALHKIFQNMYVVKKVARHYGDLTTLN